MNKKVRRLISQLEKEGVEVSIKIKTVKHTFEVPEDSLKQFFAIVDKKNLKIKDAVAEMFESWIEKNSK